MCGATFWQSTHEDIFELDGKEVMRLTPFEEQSRTINGE
jgi:hypothetical protein